MQWITRHTEEAILCTLKNNLVMSQIRMKQQVNKYRSKNSFAYEDLLFSFLQHYKQTSLKNKLHNKLAPKFYGPYKKF